MSAPGHPSATPATAGLIVFPTPNAGGPGAGTTSEADAASDGVFLRRVDGLYAGRRNEPEAAAVVEAVRRHARMQPGRSLLVATLNADQADLIDGLLERAEKDDPALGDFRVRHAGTQEPLAVKNLENVQGDKRDGCSYQSRSAPTTPGSCVSISAP